MKRGLKIKRVGAMRDRMIENNLSIVEGSIEEARNKIARCYGRDQESQVRIPRIEQKLTSNVSVSDSAGGLHCQLGPVRTTVPDP